MIKNPFLRWRRQIKILRGAGLLFGALWLAILPSAAQDKPIASPDGVWQPLSADKLPDPAHHILLPRLRSFRAFTLQQKVLQNLLQQAPREFTLPLQNSPLTLNLPLPDGRYGRFRVVESPILSPALAAQRPDVKTYLGQGIDDPTATVRFDSIGGVFHAMILSQDGQVFIDPYTREDTEHCLVYYKHDAQPPPNIPVCLTGIDPLGELPANPTRQPSAPSGSALRTYRLAIACTGEYTVASGGTTTTAQNRIITSVNRVSGVYEVEVAIRLNLVATQIYTNPNTDPFSNDNPSALLGQNQSVLDGAVGSANYDIGHNFSTGGGGVAQLRCVCINGSKSRGVTGLPNPVGDAFDIDFVAHEMGHQFGGNHTFAGTSGNCGGNVNSFTAYEPGSGSTIMAYAGICSPQNLQSNSDAYFHTISFDEIVAYRDGGGSRRPAISTGNTPPTIDAGPNYTIPQGTPFVLTATASDANGDPLTYCWEEFDRGGTTATQPLFRSFLPTVSPSRTFPRLSSLLANQTATLSETLPTVNRNMRFRCTARDNRAGGGGVDYDTTTITVSGAPFAVTSPNTAVSWLAGSTQTVTWTVGGGSVAPTVNILLSTDGGNNYSTLVASTPNDGSEAVTLPNVTSSTCRIKVEAIGNIFFDISNVNFSLSGPPPVITTLSPASRTAGSLTFSLTVTGTGFASGNIVRWNGANRVTSFVSPTELRATIPTSLLAAAGTANVTVFSSLSGTSNTLIFTIAPNVVTGTITLPDCVNTAQTLTFTFRPASGGTDLVRTQTLTPADAFQGTYSFSDVPPRAYFLSVKGAKWLRKTVAVDTAASTALGPLTLPGGDANNDNSVDALDLAALISAFNTALGEEGYSDAVDFNCDTSADALDLAILISNFNQDGDV